MNIRSKTVTVIVLLLGLVALCSIRAQRKAGADTRAYPSRFLTITTNDAELAFIVTQLDDLRTVFCDRATMRARISKSLCAVDFVMGGDGPSCEVPVRRLTRVADVLKAVRVKWNGGQPQIRVVSRDAIVQSSLGLRGLERKKAISSFLGQPVSPGDMVIIGYRE